LDNIIIKGLRIIYNGEESLPSVWKCILEYIIWLDRVFIDLKQVKCIILGAKSHFYKNEIIIISYYCNGKGQYFKMSKVAKIIYGKTVKMSC